MSVAEALSDFVKRRRALRGCREAERRRRAAAINDPDFEHRMQRVLSEVSGISISESCPSIPEGESRWP